MFQLNDLLLTTTVYQVQGVIKKFSARYASVSFMELKSLSGGPLI